jgi:hypothetical protein
LSEEEFPGAISHFNLRRSLAAHFGRLEFDNEVDDLQAHRDRVQVEVKKMWPLVDETNLSLQQNVQKMLSLLRVFTFY